MNVIIPVYDYGMVSALCHDLLAEEAADILIVDNGMEWYKDWERANSGIQVLTPMSNLHWCGGLNAGIEYRIFSNDGFLLLNDDVRLSVGFVAGLLAASEANPDAIIGPMYDDVWDHQKVAYRGSAFQYKPKDVEHEVPFIDGTAMYIPRDILHHVGLLNCSGFGSTGWGAEMDYAIRVKQAGYRVLATERSYLNHYRAYTSRKIFSNYEQQGSIDCNEGMTRKYGPDWKDML